ncbi:MAG: adenylosuccinate lyase [Opitutales bacterium]|nr:adenylosuccinate lyase [Opitutales bacterium]
MKDLFPNVLAERYASSAQRALWSPRGKIRLERELWIAVLRAQKAAGLAVPEEAIAAYEAAKDDIDLDDIAARERQTRHDVKARIESFNAVAGHEHIHKGMTSRDLTENVEQLQVHRALRLVVEKSVAALNRLADRAAEYADVPLTARTHNVPAQPTTVGKRFAMFGEEWLGAVEAADRLLAAYPARGLKGAVGTQLDLLTLAGGDEARVEAIESAVADHLGLPANLETVGQVYPRSLDFAVVSALVSLGSGPADFAKTLRLMAGQGLATEGFAKGQVGSSAMPHKMNARSCERIGGFHILLKGYLAMAAGLAGDQWNEGDVACSVVRRVMLPDAFLALDGMLETLLSVLDTLAVFPARIEAELRATLPFLATTTVLMEAVKRGTGRETAHEAIKEHAVAAARALQETGASENDLFDRLADDSRIGLNREELEVLVADPVRLTGRARAQTASFVDKARAWLGHYPAARDLAGEAIL